MEVRSFQSKWFQLWKWLYYVENKDVAFCHTCVSAVKAKKLTVSDKITESAFISGVFSNWKDASRCFNKHEESALHKKAVDLLIVIPSTHKDVAEMLSSSLGTQKRENRLYLTKVAQNIRFLVRQGLPLRVMETRETEISCNFSGFGVSMIQRFLNLSRRRKTNTPAHQFRMSFESDGIVHC